MLSCLGSSIQLHSLCTAPLAASMCRNCRTSTSRCLIGPATCFACQQGRQAAVTRWDSSTLLGRLNRQWIRAPRTGQRSSQRRSLHCPSPRWLWRYQRGNPRRSHWHSSAPQDKRSMLSCQARKTIPRGSWRRYWRTSPPLLMNTSHCRTQL